MATAPVLTGLVLPCRYREDSGSGLAGGVRGAAGAAVSAGTGLLPTTRPGGGDEIAMMEEQARMLKHEPEYIRIILEELKEQEVGNA